MQPLIKVAAGIAAAGAACFGWGLLERGWYTVRRATADILPAGARPVRALHLSDFHLTVNQARKQRFIASLAGLQPDLVVNTGDNIAQPEAIGPLIRALEPLRGVPGVFAFGSNDYHAPILRNPLMYLLKGPSHRHGRPSRKTLPSGELADQLEGLGWVNLTQARTELAVAGQRFAFRGTDDAHLELDDYSAVAGPADPDAVLNVGVTHAPYLRLLDAMTTDGVELIFAGHTHGGQVCVPGYGALITNCDLDTARAKGLSTHTADGKTSHLHVSAGLGTSPAAPYRFACRPEVTLLTLRPRA